MILRTLLALALVGTATHAKAECPLMVDYLAIAAINGFEVGPPVKVAPNETDPLNMALVAAGVWIGDYDTVHHVVMGNRTGVVAAKGPCFVAAFRFPETKRGTGV